MGSELEVPRSELGLGPNLQPRTVAVIPRRRGMHLDCAGQLQFSNPPQVLAQDFLLDLELMLVTGVLIMASAAGGKVWTARLNALRRSLDDRIRPGAGEAGLLLSQGSFDFFASKHERHKYSLAAPAFISRKARQSVAAVDQLFNGEEQEVILRHGEGHNPDCGSQLLKIL
jgi:hypothetical protein